MKNKKNLDNILTGMIPGLLIPLITLLIIWKIRYDGGLMEFLATFHHMDMLSKLLSLACLPNLLLFFVFIWTNRIISSRGVIFATLIIAVLMLVLKFA